MPTKGTTAWKERGRRYPLTPGELRKMERKKATLEKYRKIRESSSQTG
jgi:hypothetical protein